MIRTGPVQTSRMRDFQSNVSVGFSGIVMCHMGSLASNRCPSLGGMWAEGERSVLIKPSL